MTGRVLVVDLYMPGAVPRTRWDGTQPPATLAAGRPRIRLVLVLALALACLSRLKVRKVGGFVGRGT